MAWFQWRVRWEDVSDEILEQATDEFLRRQEAREKAESTSKTEDDSAFLRKLGIKA